MGEEVVECVAAMWPDNEGVAHISEPQGGRVDVPFPAGSMAMVLKDSVYRSASISERGEPIGASSTCS